MNARQQKVLARFGQVITFLDANTSTVDPASVAGQRQTLATAVTQITAFAQDQVVKGTESVMAQTVSSARTSLRDTYLRQLSAVGLHNLTGKNPGDPDVPNAKQIFALPATHTNPSVLVQAAQNMVSVATQYASVFTAGGVNLDAVNSAIQALDAAVNANTGAKRISKGATQGIKAQIQAGHAAVHLMDVVVRPQLASNKALLTQWESVKRAAGGLNLTAPLPVPGAVPSVGGQATGTSGTPAASTPQTSAPVASPPATAAATAETQPSAGAPSASTQPVSQPAAAAAATA